jgi:N-acyl-D-amino-acid deacylase
LVDDGVADGRLTDGAYDFLIRGGLVVDGTGRPPFPADVGISGDRIAAIGPNLLGEAREVIDAVGCFVTPGIVDIHTHADWTISVDPRAVSALLQGVTTVTTGNCGHGVAPLGDVSWRSVLSFGIDERTDRQPAWQSFPEWLEFLRSTQPAVNVVPLVGHGALRLAITGPALEPATDRDVRAMAAEVDAAMAAGAAGFSSGLEYQPGQSSGTTELRMLAEVVGQHDGLYATHCRNRVTRVEQAALEAIDIARLGRCRLQLSHFISRPYGDTADYDRALARMAAARADGMDAYMDLHPHIVGPGPIAQVLPDWAWQRGPDGLPEDLEDDRIHQRVLADLDSRFKEALRSGVADAMLIAHAPNTPAAVGRTLGDLAREQGQTSDVVAVDLLRRAGRHYYAVTELEEWAIPAAFERAIGDDAFLLMGDGLTLATDGPLSGFHFCHADWNWVPTFVYEHVREHKYTSIESAIRRMTSVPARQLRLADVGEIRPGWIADIAVLERDPKPLGIATSNPMAPLNQLFDFARFVLVRGTKAVHMGVVSDSRAGIVGLDRSPAAA